jgi:hypothetical protein
VRKRRLLLLASSEPFTEKRKGVCRSNDEILFGRFLACHFLELAPCFLACHFLCSDAAAPLLLPCLLVALESAHRLAHLHQRTEAT